MQFSTIIFDYDGVLADNQQFNFLACQAAAKACGIDLAESAYAEYFYSGQSLAGGAATLLATEKKSDLLQKFIAAKADQDWLYAKAVKPIPGAIEFVKWCVSQKFRLAIGSGARQNLIKIYLEKYQLSANFETIISAEKVTQSKPHPETYLKTLAKLNCQPRSAIIIEDSVAGILAGTLAGCTVIGIVTTSPAEKLNLAKAIAKNYTEMPQIIKSLQTS